MQRSVVGPTLFARGSAVMAAAVVVIAGVVYALPAPAALTEGVSGGSIAVLWVLLIVTQVAAVRRTGGIDRRAWIVMIAFDVTLFVLFVTDAGTDSYLPSREPLPAVWVLGPVSALQGLVVLLIFGRRVIKDTNGVAFAADAAWLAVAAQIITWPAVAHEALHIGADSLTATTIVVQGALAAALAGTLGALVLRTAATHHLDTVKLGIGIVALRYTTVIFYATWLGDGAAVGGAVDLLLLSCMAAMVATAALGPEASRRVRGTNPNTTALLAATWIPILIFAASLSLLSLDLDGHSLPLVGVGAVVLVIRLSVELRLSGHLREQLQVQATTDALTDLPNRTTLEAELSDSGERLKSLMVIDLDRFKAVNDQLGHAIGDEVLRQVAMRLESVLGDDWLLTRPGGDEFIAVSTIEGDTGKVEQQAEALIDVLEPGFLIRGREAWIGASIGVATVTEGIAGSELLPVADLALRRAKNAGRGVVVVSDTAMRTRASDTTRLATALERALREGEICCAYQPQIDLVSGDIVGVEALVRWNHPERGLLPPAEFLDVAEGTGLVARLDETVLRLATAQLAAWNMEFPGRRLSLSTNMSPCQLARRDVADDVVRCIASAGKAIDPGQITIELTETVLIDDPAVIARRVERLRSTGVNVSVDDFGSGFTSIAHLRDLPISEVKIDRSLTAEIRGDDLERSVAGAVIALAQALELTVVAEGVETAAQADALRRLGCRTAQGFLFSRPVPGHQITDWLRHGPPFAPLLATDASTAASPTKPADR